SVAHQSRMSKIAELVSAGDVDPSKPVLEQPGGPPQKIIRELLSRDDEAIFDPSIKALPDEVSQSCPSLLVLLKRPLQLVDDHYRSQMKLKERQRDKDSPYNFSVPPQMGIDLDTYEKTGETKVVPLASAAELKREPSPKPAETPTVPPLNLQAMMQQMQHANPFQFMDPAGMISGPMTQLSQSSTSGRRANRTRFTDYQLRTLQQFFDKQAYPKDDDLEVLSKKLQLSPRIGNFKARKIYENQPNHENADRFVRTPGCNFQCKRCSLVFQRYYELIQHQQKKCYKDDCQAQANDNKIVEESLTDEEKAQLIQQTALASISDAKPADLAKLLGASKSSTEALLKLCESANTSPSSTFHKRCPFCGLLFRSRQSLQEHIPARHPQQHSVTPVDVDLLPNAEDVSVATSSTSDLRQNISMPVQVPVLIPPTNTTENKDLAGALDLSNASQERDTLSMSPFLGQSDDDPTEFIEENPASYAGSSSQSRSPTSNKRYRTHLTPTQVHVMKSVFGDYKTPSMTECEALGREIGLHKRVVQVWFQNARAKERKTRSATGEEEVNRSTSTSCTMCGVEYGGRITLQDHLFSLQHLNGLKAQLRVDAAPVETPSAAFPSENGGERRAQPARPTKTTVPSQLSSLNLNGFPFSFMNGMMPGALPLVYDPAMFGTPVSMLQIPDSVKMRIKSDITAGLSSTRFTQDGLSVDELRKKLDAEDARTLCHKEVEVGWACPSCTNVFQQEALLKNHQRTVCQGTDA
ncbi:homeobox domain protein, partial [Teladorsagia circumcincta]